MMKKVLSSILATVLLLSCLTVSVFAIDSLPFTDEDYLREDFGYHDYKQYQTGSINNKCVTWPEGTLVASGNYFNGDYEGYNDKWDSDATTINFPTSTVIIESCLNGHKSVTTVNWEELVNLKYIGVWAAGYTKISTLDLRNTQVVRIGDGAFSTSSNLTTFKAPSTLKRIDANAFESCLRLWDVELNEGLEYIGDNALGWGYANAGYNNLIIPSTVTHIGAGGLRTDKTYRVYQGTYGEQWCKDNNVKYTYVDGSPNGNSSSSEENTPTTPTNNTTAPTMEHTQKVGGVTFSNFVSQREVISKDVDGKDIPVYVVEIGPNGCMRSDVDNTDFIYWFTGTWNSYNSYNGKSQGVYTDKGAWNGDYRTETLDMHNITAYPSTKNSSGTWSKGLTWQYGEFSTEYVDHNKYNVTVNQGSNVYHYFIKVVQNPVYSTNTETPQTSETTTPSQSATANPNNSKVLVNGKAISFDSYTINGNNYFKLRDIANTLSGTEKQFNVIWDSSIGWMDSFGSGQGAIRMTAGEVYTPVGGEMTAGDGVAKQCTLNNSPIYLGEQQVNLTAYTINGNNYFKLRDLGATFNFNVSWDGVNNAIVINTSENYDANN